MAWTQKQWNNVTGTPQAGDLPLDADNMNRLEDGISEALDAATNPVLYHGDIYDPENHDNSVNWTRSGDVIEVTLTIKNMVLPANTQTELPWTVALPAPVNYIENREWDGLVCAVMSQGTSTTRIVIRNQTSSSLTQFARWHFTYIVNRDYTRVEL